MQKCTLGKYFFRRRCGCFTCNFWKLYIPKVHLSSAEMHFGKIFF
nr:MAG TPA: hypothetical protein [Caudoviricetes sp.]